MVHNLHRRVANMLPYSRVVVLAFVGIALAACGSGRDVRAFEADAADVRSLPDADDAGSEDASLAVQRDAEITRTQSCAARSCEDEGVICGAIADGCGGTLSCGVCRSGRVCEAGGKRCISRGELCELAGSECGAIADACGVGVACGRCAPGDVCNVRTGSCGECQPRTCTERESCGVGPDGCGGTLDCGTCGAGLVCDALSLTCVPCQARTCADAGHRCGVASDGCGGTQDCGDCPGGFFCSEHACVPVPLDSARKPGACVAAGAECGTVISECSRDPVDYDYGCLPRCTEYERSKWRICLVLLL